MSNFYWPGIDGDVARYCHSCDLYQKTVSKGTVHQVKLCTVVYILTLVDYAIRYPETVSLKRKLCRNSR